LLTGYTVAKVLYYLLRPWRVPLVAFRKYLGPKTPLRNGVKHLVRFIGRAVYRVPFFRFLTAKLLSPFPTLKARLSRLAGNTVLNTLSPRARQIYLELTTAIEAHKKERM